MNVILVYSLMGRGNCGFTCTEIEKKKILKMMVLHLRRNGRDRKKDPADQPDQGAVTVAFHGNVDQSGFDMGSDLNVEPPGPDDDKRTDLVYNDAKQRVQNNAEASHVSEQGSMHQGHPVAWDDALSSNPMRENKLLCQENSTNEDFDDETFGRERPVGLLSASLL